MRGDFQTNHRPKTILRRGVGAVSGHAPKTQATTTAQAGVLIQGVLPLLIAGNIPLEQADILPLTTIHTHTHKRTHRCKEKEVNCTKK